MPFPTSSWWEGGCGVEMTVFVFNIIVQTMFVELPYDIWAYIASFLSESELLDLYSIHPAFLHCFMKVCYGRVTIASLKEGTTLRCYMNMSPATAKSVRTLILKPHSFGQFMYWGPFGYVARATWKILKRCRLQVKLSNASAASRLLKLIKSMTNLESLVIASVPFNRTALSSLALTFIHTSLTSHTSNVRSLSISVPFIPALRSSLMIYSLEEFKVVFHATFDPDNVYPIITLFCTRHSQTLTSVSLLIEMFDNDIGISHLFANMPHLPFLTKVGITVTVDHIESQQVTNIDTFLQKHANSLRRASFSVSDQYSLPDLTLPELFSHPFFCVELPHLTTLDLGLFYYHSTNRFHQPSPLALYLKRFQHSLIEFTLSDYILPFSHLDEVLTAFDKHSTLQFLKVQTSILKAEVLDCAFEHLPCLIELDWTIAGFPKVSELGEEVPYFWELDKHAQIFANEVAKRKFEGWSLRKLTIRPLLSWDRMEEKIQRLFQANLPSSIVLSVLPGSSLW